MKDLRKKRTDRKGRGLWRRCLGFVRPNQFMLWVWVCIRLQSRAAAQLGIGKPCTCVAGSSLVGLGWTRKLWSHPLWLLQVYAASAMSTKSGWPCISVTTISNNLSPNLVAEKEPCGIAHRFLDQEFKLLTAWLSCLFFFPNCWGLLGRFNSGSLGSSESLFTYVSPNSYWLVGVSMSSFYAAGWASAWWLGSQGELWLKKKAR